MTRHWFFFGLAVTIFLVAFSVAQDSAGVSTKVLTVKVSFAGTGEVNVTHRLWVFVFDTPSISEGVVPIAWDSVDTNGGTIKFKELSAGTVYLTAMYDKSGGYDPSYGPPPSGSPVAMYRPDDPALPTAVHLDTGEVDVEFSFNDSFVMP